MKKILLQLLLISFVLASCSTEKNIEPQLTHSPKWFDSMTIYEVNIRQYTEEGTFNAFKEHLPRLKELGVEILWFMPIHPISEKNRKGSLGSYYAVSDYKAVNPSYGTLEDFTKLVDECHDMGFKVILDWVPNHTGWDNVWIEEHPDWYTQENGEIIHPKGTDWTDVADLNYNNNEMRDEMISSMEYWVNEADIDGFRCDVAGSVPTDFWNRASLELNSIKPLFMLAEDSSNFSLLRKAFNSNYNWSLLGSMRGASNNTLNRGSIKDSIRNSILRYPYGTFPINFITNHDENSWNGTANERLGNYKELFTALTFIMPGMPLIYSGQEANLDKRLLFFEKDNIDWSDLSNSTILKKLIEIKKSNISLYNGSAGGNINFINTTSRDTLSFARVKESNKVIFIGNLSDKDISFELREFKDPGLYMDAFNNEEINLKAGSTLELKAYQFKIFIIK